MKPPAIDRRRSAPLRARDPIKRSVPANPLDPQLVRPWDQNWFDAHPSRAFYLRRPYEGECDSDASHVAVCDFGDGIGLRRFAGNLRAPWSFDAALANCDTEAVAHRFFIRFFAEAINRGRR